MDMFMNACIATVLGWLSVANAQNRFCSGDLCFIRPDPNSANTWSAAQQRCKENNATLPIADNSDHQKSFVEALSYFQLNGMDVWLGAIASNDGADNWHWLDGSQYAPAETIQQRGDYYKSYAYVANTSTGILAHASAPNNSYSYICQHSVRTPDDCANFNGAGRTAFFKESRCYTRLEEKLPWFTARNKCLERNGDLASFSQLSSMDGIIDSSAYWVGLRHSHWDWRNSTSGLSSDVTYTSWRIGQPNSASPDCIATDSGDFPNWKDIDCTASYSYICQVASTATSAQPLTSTARPTTSAALPSTSDPRLLRPSSITTTTWPTRDLSSPAPQCNNSAEPVQAVTIENCKHDSSVAIGVGIGIPCVVIILALAIVVIIQQRENRKLRDKLKYKSGDSNVPESKVQKLNSHATTQQTTGTNGERNMQYEELQIRSQLQNQQQEYEQLGKEQSHYERV